MNQCRLHATPIAFFLVFVTLGCSRSDEGAKRDASPKGNDTTTSNLKSSTVPPSLGIVEWYPDNNPKVILQMRGDSVLERIEYYASGQVQSRGQLLEDARHGIWNSYYSSGLPWSQVGYQRGAKHGVYRTYHENGEPAIEGQHIDNNKAGTWLFFDDSGKLIREREFSRD